MTHERCLISAVTIQPLQTLSLEFMGIMYMKKRITTHFEWNPCLAWENNMLAYMHQAYGQESIWLHSVKITHLSGEDVAIIEIVFFYAPPDIGELDFFRDFKVVENSRFKLAGLNDKITDFLLATGAQQIIAKHDDVCCVSLPLNGRPFTDRALEAACAICKHIATTTTDWIPGLKVRQTSEVKYLNKWIPFETYVLFRKGLINAC